MTLGILSFSLSLQTTQRELVKRGSKEIRLTILRGLDQSPLTEPRPRYSAGIYTELVVRKRVQASDSKIKTHSTEPKCFRAVSFLMKSIAKNNPIRQCRLFPRDMDSSRIQHSDIGGFQTAGN